MSAVLSTQVVQQVLERYSNATNIRASQVVQQVLETYSNTTNIRASQVVLQVLRTVSGDYNIGTDTITTSDAASITINTLGTNADTVATTDLAFGAGPSSVTISESITTADTGSIVASPPPPPSPPSPSPLFSTIFNRYVDLITPFFRGQPRFEATVGLVTDILARDRMFVVDNLPSCFDVDTAIGVQLDKTGEWIGRDRYLHTPISNAYFSFDISGLGFDQAVWAGYYSPIDQITALDDETYRCLLYAKIEANNSDGTVSTIQKIYSDFLACNNVVPGTNIYIEDRQDMSMIVGLAGKIPPLLYLELMTTEFVPLKPEGVRLFFAETTVDNSPIFGFDLNNVYIKGFDNASWASITQV